MKTKIMLIFPPHTRGVTSVFPPLGIGYIASYVLSKNPKVQIRILDFTVSEFSIEGLKSELKKFCPEILGISVLTINFPFATLIARLVKQHDSRVVVVIGGVHATLLPEECLAYCDIVVRGEGEETFWEIVRERPLDSIDGISFRKNGRIVNRNARAYIRDLDVLPYPAHHLFEMKKYECFPGWGIMASRGCPYQCIFCSSPIMWGRQLRIRSAKSVVDEIEYLHRTFGIIRITFLDDTINVPRKRAIEICNEIIKRGLHREISFVCQMRANRQFISLELFKKMQEANFIRVEFGIESGSQKVLNSIGKSLTVNEAKNAVRMAKKAGIPIVKGFFMVGNWGEGITDVLATWYFILRTPVYPVFSICTPFPGTRFFKMLEEEGYIRSRCNWQVFDQCTAISRTNRMSRICILFLYALSSLFFELILAFVRGRSFVQTVHGVIRMLRHKSRRIRQKLPTFAPEGPLEATVSHRDMARWLQN